jgi:hypothetical protein
MASGDPDRAAIIARRGLFVSSALALLVGCSSSKPASTPQPTVVAVPEPSSAPRPSDDKPRADVHRDDPNASGPSLEIPDGIGREARQRFERLIVEVKAIHALLDRMTPLVPAGCNVTNPSCDSRWRMLADALVELEERSRLLYPMCPGSSDAAKLYAARARAHLEVVAERREDLEDRILQNLGSEAEQRRWQEHQRAARLAQPASVSSISCKDW